jgi:hypothetical protein
MRNAELGWSPISAIGLAVNGLSEMAGLKILEKTP